MTAVNTGREVDKGDARARDKGKAGAEHMGVCTQVWVGSDFQSSYTDSEPLGRGVVLGSGKNTKTI